MSTFNLHTSSYNVHKFHRLALVVVVVGVCLGTPQRATSQAPAQRTGAVDVLPSPPPATPRGLPVCANPLPAPNSLVARQGEVIEYDVEVMHINVGTLQFSTGRQGTHQGEAVTELRGDLAVNRGVAMIVPLEGSAASLVTANFIPVQSAQRYRWTTVRSQEMQTYSSDGREVMSKRVSNDGPSDLRRSFPMPVQDFLSGFYFLRSVPRKTEGCTVIYSNQEAYTVWLLNDGEELVSTPWGKRKADRYKLRYGADKHKKVKEALIWVSQDERRVPYRAQGLSQYKPLVEIKGYKAP